MARTPFCFLADRLRASSDACARRRSAALGMTALALLATTAQAAIYTVGTPTAPGQCTHATLQAAVDAANASAGADTVRVTRSLAYTAQQVVVNTAQDLNIVGGFATCSTPASDGQKTVISGAGGNATSVLAVLLNSTAAIIKLRHLRITGGDAPAGGFGGGINFNGSGTLEISESAIDGNSAGYGGGIHFKGGNTGASLTIGSDTLINSNAAQVSGGGIYLERATMTMNAPGSSLFANTAVNYGGGLRLYGASGPGTLATVGSGGYGGFAAIEGNEARFGGGVAVQGLEDDGVGDARFVLTTADPARPGRISHNFASERGGGIDLRNFFSFGDYGDVNATISDGYLEANVAPVAAAVYVGHDDDPLGLPRGSTFQMSGGRIVGHVSANAANQPTGGAIVLVSEDASGQIGRVLIQGNTGGPVLLGGALRDDVIQLSLANSLVTGNTVQGSVIGVETSGSARITDTTFAGNTLSGSAVLSVAGNLHLATSIIWQPGKTSLQLGGSLVIDDVIAGEIASLGNGPQAILAAPRFIDPARADYRLRAASAAVDFAPKTSGGHDLGGLPRGQDLPVKSNFRGPRDLGAYERQSLAPLVLNQDFDADFNL